MKSSKKTVITMIAMLLLIIPTVAFMGSSNATVQAAKTSSKGMLTLNYNSYFYGKNGKRLKTYKGSKRNTVIAKGKKVKYMGNPEQTTELKKHYFAKYTPQSGNTYYWLPYKNINGHDYYRVGKNAYIRADNIGSIDGETMYYRGTTYVTGKNDSHTYDSDMNENDDVVKKGQKVAVDKLVSVEEEDIDTQFYYKIAGKDEYIYGGEADYEYNVTPRQNLEVTDFKSPTKAQLIFNKDADVYTINGTKKDHPYRTTTKGAEATADELLYIWLPDEQKSELFYHLPNVKSYVNSIKKDEYIGEGFVKASDVDVDNDVKLKPVNTEKEAEAGAITASSDDKKELQSLINDEQTVKAGDPYKLSESYLRVSYDQALDAAKQTNASSKASIAEVKQAAWLLDKAAKSLNGAKVQVTYLNKITNREATKIEELVSAATGDWATFVNHNTKLISFDDDNVQHTLNIADYATQAPEPARKKSKTDNESSLYPEDLKKDATLRKYNKLINYDQSKTVLVAKRNTKVYRDVTKQNPNIYMNVNKVKLAPSKTTLKKGDNIGYYVNPVVKIKGKYYFLVAEKKVYYVPAQNVKRDNFAKSPRYKKYKAELDRISKSFTKNSRAMDVTAKVNTYDYLEDPYGEINLHPDSKFKKGQVMSIGDPKIVKVNGRYYFAETLRSIFADTDGYAVRAADVKPSVRSKKLYSASKK